MVSREGIFILTICLVSCGGSISSLAGSKKPSRPRQAKQDTSVRWESPHKNVFVIPKEEPHTIYTMRHNWAHPRPTYYTTTRHPDKPGRMDTSCPPTGTYVGAATAQFTRLPAGKYEVWLFYRISINRSKKVPWRIIADGQGCNSDCGDVNMYGRRGVGAAKWYLLASTREKPLDVKKHLTLVLGSDENNGRRSISYGGVKIIRVANASGKPLAPGPKGEKAKSADETVLTFRIYEVSLLATRPVDNPYANGPAVSAVFSGVSGKAKGKSCKVEGFWDGGRTYRIRFAPTAPGKWSYVTSSSDPGLDGRSGAFQAKAPSARQLAANPLLGGFLEAQGHAWKLSDGNAFLPVGDTQWSFSEEFTFEEFKDWMSALHQRGLNTLHGCVWLAKYTRNGLSPFKNRDPATDLLQIEYFRQLDRMITYANDNGIMVGLTIGGFPDNTRWWKRFGTRQRDDRWFRYCVARYAAYNVRWVLYGEVNEKNPPWNTTWQNEVKHKANLVKRCDPYDHPIGSHHTTVDTSSADDPNIDYIEVQSGHESQYRKALNLRKYGKPIWEEEYWYEYNRDNVKGIQDTHRNLVAALAFPTFGSAMRAHARHDSFAPRRAKEKGMSLKEYLLKHDVGLRQMGYFASFFRGIDTLHFSPAGQRVDRGQCGKFGPDYAVFLKSGGRVTIDLRNETGVFEVVRMNIYSGEVKSLPSLVGGGRRTINTGTDKDVSLLIRRKDARQTTRPNGTS